jgi:hypothetical protein
MEGNHLPEPKEKKSYYQLKSSTVCPKDTFALAYQKKNFLNLT